MNGSGWLKGLLIAAWGILLVFGFLNIIGVMDHICLLTMLGTMILLVGLMFGGKNG